MSSERQSNDINTPWWGEHIHRYQEALKLIPLKSKILDIACGNGFGSNILCNSGHQVVGADISEEAIKSCGKIYNHPRLEFKIIDGTNTGYGSGHFDAIVSFETIEHTHEYLKMLLEFKRVTKENGFIILSTPNIKVNSPKGVVTNPYHTQEWTFDQLQELLGSVFPSVKIYGQQYSRYAGLINFRSKIAKTIELILYMRGIRKLPLGIQNAVMNFFINKPMYPLADDYTLVSEESEIKSCKTFFAICKS